MAKFVRIPKRGDIAANDLVTRKTMYIPREHYNASDIEGTHEVLGAVAGIIGNEALIVHPDCGTSAKWTNRLWWYCTGYTLDGESHTITFSLRFATNSWSSNIAKTVTYASSSLSALISALNTAFAADADFTAQEWYADEYDGKLRLTCEDIHWSQPGYNSASGGLAIGGCMPEIVSHANMRRKHGGNGGEGAISSMARALIFYRNDNGADTYLGGRTTEQTSIKQTYPINLPTWLGTSTKNPGDFCAPLRAIYGEGEEGWLRFMKSCLPVTPTDYGDMGVHDGKSICKPLAQISGRKMSSSDIVPLMASFAKPYNLIGNTFSKGDFWLPTVEEISVILKGENTSTDPLNLGLAAIGGSTVLNSANLWSCLRYYSNHAWIAHDNLGFFTYGRFNNSFRVVPVSRSII